LDGGVPYAVRARKTSRRARIRRARVAGLLVAITAIAAIPPIGDRWAAPSSSMDSSSATPAPSIPVRRRDRPGHAGETRGAAPDGRTGALGEAGGHVPEGTTVFDDEVPGVAKLDAHLLGALRRAAADAAGDGVRFSVDSGWRSPEYQERLFREAIAKYGSEAEARRWVATPGTSSHVSGDAVDIGPSDGDAWLSVHGAAYGLCQIYANEPWHYELRPEAGAHGCPAMYADPTHDPRMHR
jgi:zinc D-Ala-D-Ala carboxypeptidase